MGLLAFRMHLRQNAGRNEGVPDDFRWNIVGVMVLSLEHDVVRNRDSSFLFVNLGRPLE